MSTALQTVNTQLTPLEREKQIAIAQYTALVDKEDSLARRVYLASEDKENPISLPIVEYLEQKGYVKLIPVSRLPALNAQANYEGIYELMTEPGLGEYLFTAVLSDLNEHFIDDLKRRTNGTSPITEGLRSLGINDPQLCGLFERRDLTRFIEHVSTKYPQIFQDVPVSGPNHPIHQLEYYTKWKAALEELGLSRLRKECRDHGIEDTVLDSGRASLSRSAIMAQFPRTKWINESIQSIDLYARINHNSDGNFSGIQSMLAFVEMTEPKGLVISYKDFHENETCDDEHRLPARVRSLLLSGMLSGCHSSERLPAYETWRKSQKFQVHRWLSIPKVCLSGVAGGLVQYILAGSAAVSAGSLLIAGMLGYVVAESVHYAYNKFRDFPQKEEYYLAGDLRGSLPFPGLTSKGAQNYMALYQLEGRLIPEEKK